MFQYGLPFQCLLGMLPQQKDNEGQAPSPQQLAPFARKQITRLDTRYVQYIAYQQYI